MAKIAKTERDSFAHARQNAKAWFELIEKMVARHEIAEEQARTGGDETEATRREIEESVLSVQVREGWRMPGGRVEKENRPEEYEILLSTGGPALRIVGQLDQYCQPSTAEMQMQDWGLPWTRYPAPEAQLLAFAAVFWFGGE